MISLPRLTLRLRLSISIIAIVALFTLTNLTYQLSSENRNLRLDNLQNAVASQLATVTIRQLLENQQKEILVLDALKDGGKEKLSEEEIDNGLSALLSLQTEIRRLKPYVYADTVNSYNTLLSGYDALHERWYLFYVGYNNNKTPSTIKIEREFANTMQLLSEFESLEILAAEQQTLELQKTVRFTDRITLAIYLFTIALTVSLGYLLIRYTNRSLNELNLGTVRIGGGDLKYHIPVNNDDEIGDLTIAFNEMSDKLSNAMAQVQQSKEKADQANRSKTNFLANMSHELRTPLNAIIGYSEMIIEDYREEKTLNEEQAVEDLARILSSGRHLLQLINDVLDLAKIESGNMTVFNETFDSVDIIEELMNTMSPIAKKGDNLLVLEKSQDIPNLYNDAVKFRQLFLNLLSNACKFTHNGKITILVTYNEKTRHAVYHVSDTGIGMTPSQLTRVFEAFVQADSSTSKKYGGTGLGLSICKQFVELMDGSMDVTSAEGEGTTFTILLPTRTPLQKRTDAIPAENQQELSLDLNAGADTISTTVSEEDALGRVLVIDDDPESRQLLLRHLEKESYIGLEAEDAKQGIAIANEQQPDLILLDLMMPNIDGWTALSVLKESPSTRHIPVILQSMLDEKNLGLDLGAAEFLPKPVDRQRMATILRHLNPQDRRGSALLIAPETDSRQLLLEELADEAWQCMVATSMAQVVERIQQKSPDIIFVGLGMPYDSVVEILSMLSGNADASDDSSHDPETENTDEENHLVTLSTPITAPIYVVSETPLGSSQSRRLDLPADQIILFNKEDKSSLEQILNLS
ncbi:ATP-binding protein [Pseudomonadales bacterium]|nr:ATP-binding protein [Pseudomonadales bacterium]